MGGGAAKSEAAGPEQVGGHAFLGQVVEGLDPKDLRAAVDTMKQRVGSGIAALVAVNDGRASVAVGVTDDLAKQVSAVDLVKAAVAALGGQGGGGRPDMAQGGGPDGSKADEALAAVKIAGESRGVIDVQVGRADHPRRRLPLRRGASSSSICPMVSASARRCTCSICRMRGAVAVTANLDGLRQSHKARINLAAYRFNTGTAEHHFCSNCGIYTHHKRRSNPQRARRQCRLPGGRVAIRLHRGRGLRRRPPPRRQRRAPDLHRGRAAVRACFGRLTRIPQSPSPEAAAPRPARASFHDFGPQLAALLVDRGDHRAHRRRRCRPAPLRTAAATPRALPAPRRSRPPGRAGRRGRCRGRGR